MPEMRGSSHSSKNTRGRARKSAGARTNLVQSALEVRRERRSCVRAPDERPHGSDHLQDLGDRPLIEREDRIAAPDQLARDVGLQIREGEDQVGLQRINLVEPRVDECRDLGLLPRFRWSHRIARHADHAIALPEQIQCLGRFFRETHDALGIHWNADRLSTIDYRLSTIILTA